MMRVQPRCVEREWSGGCGVCYAGSGALLEHRVSLVAEGGGGEMLTHRGCYCLSATSRGWLRRWPGQHAWSGVSVRAGSSSGGGGGGSSRRLRSFLAAALIRSNGQRSTGSFRGWSGLGSLCQLQAFGGNAEFARARWTLCECLMGDAAAAVAQCPKLPLPQRSFERLPRRRRL
eukprot:COSAG06_NODE_4286_length_4399_cov_3.887907_4_plen_174_part_00